MTELEGICLECGAHFYGRALNTRRNQMCFQCGSALEIRNNGVLVRGAFSPFKSEEYIVAPDQEYWEDLCAKNLLGYLTLN
jgi:hypothetical protein